ncbi:MAG: aminotransferase class I/II-fold pyridoxal phosphate-dependent enzyme [Thermoplasmata archaeon]|nr:aminotransferase class I/II-fold pyridoxal phosphate-dependent enzyme [Thermoplasmata archaeon]
MGFPLKDWIDAHEGLPYNLALSGMKSALRTTTQILAGPLPAADPRALRRELAQHLGVAAGRLFLTHGATEANSLALFYLRHRDQGSAPPTVSAVPPEYPPLGDAARAAGFRPARRRADVVVLSSPNNPTGESVDFRELVSRLESTRWALVDETFREFTDLPSLARRRDPRVFTTGTFTKAWAGDPIRVGFVVVPSAERTRFAEFHGVVTDEVPLDSVASARALLAARDTILAESREVFCANLACLQTQIPGVPALTAPIWFDRGSGGLDGDRFARALLRRGVLVCPGRFFGEPRGVRICLTQRTFPEDLAPYVRERRRWV